MPYKHRLVTATCVLACTESADCQRRLWQIKQPYMLICNKLHVKGQEVLIVTNPYLWNKCAEWGALKMQDRKMQDLKMRDQIAGHENAGPEKGGPSRNAASLHERPTTVRERAADPSSTP